MKVRRPHHATADLHRALTEMARPWVEAKLANPVVAALVDGTLDPAVMRRWIEQDFLYLHTYSRVFARLASIAPDHQVATLIDGAHYTIHTEVGRLIELAGLFDADLSGAEIGPACTAYTRHLVAASDRYEIGAIAVLPCMIGFSSLGVVIEAPTEPRYRRWVEMYSAGDFQAYAARFASLVNELDVDWDEVVPVFELGMTMEIALWDEAAAFADEQSRRRSDTVEP